MSSQTTPSFSLKSLIKGIPILGPAAARIAQLPILARARSLGFQGSAPFWEEVYRKGGTSGPGSYGRLAEFKAEVLNGFVEAKKIRSVIEFGCGDGAQLRLAKYPEYVGVDVSSAAVERCRALFAEEHSKRFFHVSVLPAGLGAFDLALSLDVLYHLVEDRVFEQYMNRLFGSSRRYVAIYASNFEARTQAVHVRHRKFTTWITKNARGWQPAGFVANRFPADPLQPDETSFANFHFFACKDA